MRTIITAQGFEISDALRESVRREIARFVQSADRPINFISVQLIDAREQAMRGLEKLCRVRVQYDNDKAVEDSDAEADFRYAVPEAFTKVLRWSGMRG
jgi:ribosome-associated translation inhibitor RaiA